MFLLFQQFLLIEADGVFLDEATLVLLGPSAEESLPNTTRGENPPGMFFSQPPGSDWLYNVQTLDEADVQGGFSGKCRAIPTTSLGNTTVCGSELINLYTGTTGEIDAPFLDATIGKLWLAQIRYETPAACASYMNE